MFLSFEGMDFSGKTTQIEHLARWLRENGETVTLVREPGGTTVSEKIRSLLLDTEHQTMHPVTELLLFSAARSQLVHEIITPAIARHAHVIADRFFDSTTVYQGYGRGLDVERILALHSIAAHGIEPDITIVLDISVEESLRRRIADGRCADRMEQADKEFFDRVRTGYHGLAERFPSRVHLIDGMQTEPAIAGVIRTLVDQWNRKAAIAK